MKKNVASQTIGAQMVSATDGSAFAGAVTVYVTGDAGVQAAGSVGSGACTHEGNGYHTYAPAQAETNYDLVAFTFTGTGAVPATVQVFTGYPQTGDSYARLGAPAGASVSADVAAVKSDTAAILTDTGTTLDAMIKDIPTVAEFEARTILAANYFDPAADVVAHVTLVDTTTTLTNMPAAAPSTADIKTALEVDGGKLDHLWEMTEDDAGVRRFTTNALEQSPAGGTGLTAQETADAVNNLAPASTGATGSIRAKLDAIKLITDAIDTSAVTITSTNSAGVLTFTQGVTFAATVSGLTISATWAKLYFTLKESDYDTDDMALIQIVESNPGVGTDGLLYLNSAAIALPILLADGTLTVSQVAGTVAIALTDNAMAQLSKASGLVWDIKTKDAAGATVQNATGTASIGRAITQTI